jgi:hypothetical protein
VIFIRGEREMKKWFSLVLVGLFIAFGGQVKADDIVINNYSFETPDLDHDGDWTGLDPDGNWGWGCSIPSGGGIAIIDPTSSHLVPSNGVQYALVTSSQVGYAYQTLGEQVQTGMTYTLTGSFGKYSGDNAGSLGLYTEGGDQLVLSASSNPVLNSWDPLTVTYIADSTHNGENLQIRLYFGGTGYGAWDNIHLTQTSPDNPVPLPGAVWLLGSGLAGLGLVRRKWGLKA